MPVKKGRKTRLENLKEETRTIVLYESVHRISRTLSDLLSCWGDRKAAIAREITKKFEEVHRGSLREFNENLSQIKLKGEFVLVIEGKIKRRRS